MYSKPLTAGELCTRETVFAHAQTALNEAARLMREHHVGCLVVVEESPQGRIVVGMLTDRDIVTAVVAKDIDARTLRVGDVMSEQLVTARESDSVLDVLAAMQRRGVRRMPVVGAQSQLMGVITLDDVLGVVAEQLRALVAAVETERQAERRARP